MNIFQRIWALFGSGNEKKLTCTKVEFSPTSLAEFRRCQRCFYWKYKIKPSKPGARGNPLGIAVDALLKKEFDIYRASQSPHPLFIEHDINAIPSNHPHIDEWRTKKKGIRCQISDTLVVKGEVDDIWVDTNNGDFIVAEYKTKAQAAKVFNAFENAEEWHVQQVAIYQWLLRKNGHKVSSKAYFLYYNADKSLSSFDSRLRFNLKVISCDIDDSWVEKEVLDAYECLQSSTVPCASRCCEYCLYIEAINNYF